MTAEGEKKRLRFTYEDDIVLLREVVSRNPFQSSDLWEEVKTSVFQVTKKLFNIKTIRQHIQLLLDQWIEKEKIIKKDEDFEMASTSNKNNVQPSNSIVVDEIANETPRKKVCPNTKNVLVSILLSRLRSQDNSKAVKRGSLEDSEIREGEDKAL
ncbi:unnamed protein product [Psylliodes chrysocephalus]|uniref:Uncharacterized protein n=1 Tax=Psylliodes chrysocephalus TaxID=3402493 RepID=A0A9P0D067_9CUCU|nr:unnamed protein product [Psylliodes chrysocephala]